MRIVLVHGINNQESTSEGIIDDWLTSLASRMDRADFAKIKDADVVAPFYGKLLYDWTEGHRTGPTPVAQAVSDPGSDEAQFYKAALQEMAPGAGISEAEIQALEAVDEPVEQGLPHDRRLLALLRAFETISPWRGSVVLRVLPQAFVYLKRPDAADEVDAVVRPELEREPAIVVGHSLGTIVTFKLLRKNTGPEVPLYLTLGSPLAVRAVKDAIGPRFARPPQVRRWVNALDKDDAVTIGRSLTQRTFGADIENIEKVENGQDDPHSVSMYLRDPEVVRILAQAL